MSDIGIFTTASDFSGGNYRVFKVLSYFPSDRFKLFLPSNNKDKLFNLLKYVKKEETSRFEKLLKNANWIKPIKSGVSAYIRYGLYVANEIRKEGLSLLYYPHEHSYLLLGFKLSDVKWVALFQLTPIVGSLYIENGSGLSLLVKNLRSRGLKYSQIIKAYIRLNILKFSIFNEKILVVSRSIPYELSRLGIRASFKVVEPGIGVDPCPNSNVERDFDIAFFSRVIPEKGIFDFLLSVKIIKNILKDLRVLVIGFADYEMKKTVTSYAKNLGLDVKFFFNAEKDLILSLLSRTKLLLYPSRLDAFPISLLEALSCGVPAVAYSIPAIRFNFKTPAVLKVIPGRVDQMAITALKILKDDKHLQLTRYAKEFASKFTWEDVAKSEWRILESILKSD